MPTIEDIARELGVSASTVSRALQGSRLVSEEVRLKVEEVAQELGYERRVHRRQRGRSILQIKLVLPYHREVERALFYDLGAVVSGLKRGFSLCGMNLTCDVSVPGFDPFPHKKGGDTDGFVFAFHRPSQVVMRLLREKGIPFVVMNRAIPGVSCVATDHGAGMAELIDHVRGRMGQVRPVWVSMEDLGQIHEERLEGVEAACVKRGVRFCRSRDVVSFASLGMVRAKEVFERHPEANVWMAVNDLVGAILVQELVRMGVAVPGEVAVTGFDDSPVRRLSRPALTTVRMPVEELAYFAAAQLQVAILERAPAAALVRVAGELIQGETT